MKCIKGPASTHMCGKVCAKVQNLLWQMVETDLNLRPVGGHAGTVAVLPPFEIILLVDGHQCLVEFIIHCFHADEEVVRKVCQ